MFDRIIIDGEYGNVKLKAALGYADMGYYVIPLHNPQSDGKCSCGDSECKKVGKHPRIGDWNNKCTTDAGIINKWWTDWTDANIGIVAGKSGLVVVDVDERHGGYKSFRYLKDKGDLGQHLTSLTGNGLQLIYKKNGMSFKNAQNVLPGIDIKGDNRFFVAPPSLHVNGKQYKFQTPISETEIGNIPDWLIEEITKKKTYSDKPSTIEKLNSGESDILKGIPYSQIDDTIFQYVCKKRLQGLSYEEVKILVIQLASNSVPPLNETDAIKCLDRAWSYNESDWRVEEKVISFAKLAVKKFPARQSVVPDFLPVGATILAGDAKLGKSWMALDIALAVATGGSCLGKFTVGGDGSGVLYLALEDIDVDFQERLWKSTSSFPENAMFSRTWSPAPEGLKDLREYLDANPGMKLVVIDCLENVRGPRKRGQTPYSYDYDTIEPYRKIAGEYFLSILIIHHTNKQGSHKALYKVSGTMGLNAAADQTIVLDEIKNSTKVRLSVKGRKLRASDGALTFDEESCKWTWMSPEDVMSEERAAIIQVLKEEFPDALSPKQISGITGQKHDNVRQLLLKMAEAGQIDRGARGRYTIIG